MATLKSFTAPQTDSVKHEFGMTKQAKPFAVTIKKQGHDWYHVYQNGTYIGFLHGKSKGCGGKHFAFVLEYNDDHEIRIENLSCLIWPLSNGSSILEVVESINDNTDLAELFGD